MSESGSPDNAAVAQELEALGRAVGALIEELEAMGQRVATAEDRSGKLEKTLKITGVKPGEPARLEERLGELSEENVRLSKLLKEARNTALSMQDRYSESLEIEKKLRAEIALLEKSSDYCAARESSDHPSASGMDCPSDRTQFARQIKRELKALRGDK